MSQLTGHSQAFSVEWLWWVRSPASSKIRVTSTKPNSHARCLKASFPLKYLGPRASSIFCQSCKGRSSWPQVAVRAWSPWAKSRLQSSGCFSAQIRPVSAAEMVNDLCDAAAVLFCILLRWSGANHPHERMRHDRTVPRCAALLERPHELRKCCLRSFTWSFWGVHSAYLCWSPICGWNLAHWHPFASEITKCEITSWSSCAIDMIS